MLSNSHPSWKVKLGVEHSIGRNWAEVIPIKLVRNEAGRVVALEPKGEIVQENTFISPVENNVNVLNDDTEYFVDPDQIDEELTQ